MSTKAEPATTNSGDSVPPPLTRDLARFAV